MCFGVQLQKAVELKPHLFSGCVFLRVTNTLTYSLTYLFTYVFIYTYTHTITSMNSGSYLGGAMGAAAPGPAVLRGP